MLALMAGRNAGAGISLVKEGKVSSILPHNTVSPAPSTVIKIKF